MPPLFGVINLDATQENRTVIRFCPHLYQSTLVFLSRSKSSHRVLEQHDTAAPDEYLPAALPQAGIHYLSRRACAQGLLSSMSEAFLAPASPGHLDLYPSLAKMGPNNR